MYINQQQLRQAFVNHLVQYCDLTKDRAEKSTIDFPEAMLCYLNDDYLDTCEINGEEYEKVAYWTDLGRIGEPSAPNFFFLAYYKKEDENHLSALYQCTNLDKNDFAQYKYEKHKKAIAHFFK